MKTLTAGLLLFAVVFLSACKGDQGPPGMDGEDGDSLVGSVFQVEGDFTPNNDYTLFFEFPDDFEIYTSDIVLVYIRWDRTDNGVDIWRLLPLTRIFEDGILQYNFDYTVKDVEIFMEWTIDPATMTSGDTDDQVFRIAVLPAAMIGNKSIDVNNLNAVMQSLKISQNSLKTIQLTK